MATSTGGIIATVGTVFDTSLTWVGTVANAIVGQPILLLFCVVPLVGLGVGLFKRLINVN